MKWFLEQSRRDQVALLICGLSVAVFLLWAAVVRPLADARLAADNRYRAAQASLARVENLAATLQHYQSAEARQTNNRAGNVEEMVYEATRAQGMQMPNLKTGSGGAARASFDNVRMEELLQWLYEVEINRQAQVDDMNLSALNESGRVSAIITLRQN